MGGVRPNARENGQISTSTTVRAARGAGSRPHLASVFQGSRKSANIVRESSAQARIEIFQITTLVPGDRGRPPHPREDERTIMRDRSLLGAIVLAAAGIGMAVTGAWALDDTKYPEIRGAWERPGAAQWDPTKPPGLRQQAPLTPEYQAVFEANLADAAAGGQGYNPQVICLPSGMPRVMIAYEPLEILVTPEITYIRFDQLGENRRIYTDGRSWPQEITPSFEGYSIGKWVDQGPDGSYGALQVETRGLKGPR